MIFSVINTTPYNRRSKRREYRFLHKHRIAEYLVKAPSIRPRTGNTGRADTVSVDSSHCGGGLSCFEEILIRVFLTIVAGITFETGTHNKISPPPVDVSFRKAGRHIFLQVMKCCL